VVVPADMMYHKNNDAIERALCSYVLTSHDIGQLYAVVPAVLTYRKALSAGETHKDVFRYLEG
jgi:hypothetical protein